MQYSGQTSNLKSQTSNLKPQISNLKSQTSNLKPHYVADLLYHSIFRKNQKDSSCGKYSVRYRLLPVAGTAVPKGRYRCSQGLVPLFPHGWESGSHTIRGRTFVPLRIIRIPPGTSEGSCPPLSGRTWRRRMHWGSAAGRQSRSRSGRRSPGGFSPPVPSHG